MKISIYTLNCVGGAENVILNIAKLLHLDKKDFIINLIDVKGSNLPKLEPLVNKEFNYQIISWKNQISFMYELYKSIKKEQPDIIFSSARHINVRLLILKKIFFKKKKFLIRNDNTFSSLKNYKKKFFKCIYKYANKIICQTSEMESELKNYNIPSSLLQTIYNPIDKEKIDKLKKESNPFEENSFKYIAVGRLSYQKGFDLLIKAFNKVIKSNPKSKLYILGDINYNNKKTYNELKQLINQNNLKESVIFLGYQENPYKYLENANVFVLSSRWEGLPNVLLEAKYIGIPIVATDCIPIIEKLVKSEDNGYLVKNNDIDSIADGMLKAQTISWNKPDFTDSNKEWLNIFKV